MRTRAQRQHGDRSGDVDARPVPADRGHRPVRQDHLRLLHAARRSCTPRPAIWRRRTASTSATDAGDANVAAAINFALTGTTDGTGTPLIPDLTAGHAHGDHAVHRPGDAARSGDCDTSGCGTPAGAQRPDFIIGLDPQRLLVQPRIPVHPAGSDPAAGRRCVGAAYGGGRHERTAARAPGQAAIEFALLYAAVILPLTFMMIFVSEMLWVWHSVVDFTRDGARLRRHALLDGRRQQRARPT